MAQETAETAKKEKKVGSANIACLKCDIYEISVPKAGSMKFYVSTDPRFPMALKSVMTAEGSSQINDTKSLKLNVNVSDSMFQVPKDVEVQDEKIDEPSQAEPPVNK